MGLRGDPANSYSPGGLPRHTETVRASRAGELGLRGDLADSYSPGALLSHTEIVRVGMAWDTWVGAWRGGVVRVGQTIELAFRI